MIAALAGSAFSEFRLGVVIDEAHLNFGTGAPQAARFYLDVLRPDFTIMATATPRDSDLAKFAREVELGEPNRIEISREEVVKSCLNKVGIVAFHFRAAERDERVLDMEEVAVWAGVRRHLALKKALKNAEIDLTPLMLIQVENAARGEPDSVEKVRSILKDLGFASGAPSDPVAIHVSGQPDPFFHILAFDETKEILIFKMACPAR
jgi:hypothetical protein